MSSRSRNESEQPVDDEGAEQRPRSLWQVMRSLPEEVPSEASPAKSSTEAESETSSKSISDESTSVESTAASEHSESVPASTPIPTPEESSSPDDAPSDRPKSLWQLMGSRTPETETEAANSDGDVGDDGEEQATEEDGLDEERLQEQDTEDRGDGSQSEQLAAESTTGTPPLPVSSATVATTSAPTSPEPASFKAEPSGPVAVSRNSRLSLLLGGVSLPLAALAMLPGLAMKFPATVGGFSAFVLGWMAWSEITRSRGKLSGMSSALFGMTAGLAAMYLGPLVFSGLGENWRQQSGRQFSRANLEAIGEALLSYEAEQRHFPPGTIVRREAGFEEPLHGWMVQLLPGLDYDELYQQIDLNEPFNAPGNREGMQQDIPEFFTAGADRSKHRTGLAVAHFSGLGGDVVHTEFGLARVGIFDRNSRVTRDDVIDGLSQTLIVGEIANSFPAWGEPDNWRSIGKGLNRDISGFGNAEGTGALFLKADGSVKFYSNAVSPRILQQLSTRDGQDFVDEDRLP